MSPLAIYEVLPEHAKHLKNNFYAETPKAKKVVQQPADGGGGAPAKGALRIDRERKQTLGIVQAQFKRRIAAADGDPTAAVVRALGNEADDFAAAKAAAHVYLKFVEQHRHGSVRHALRQEQIRQELIATARVACATHMDDDTSADTLLDYARRMVRSDVASASSDLTAGASPPADAPPPPSPLSFTELQTLVTAAPPDAEAAMLRRWKGEKAQLRKIERFALALGTCDRFDKKLRVALIRRNWAPHVDHALIRLETLARAADEVRCGGDGCVRQEDSIDRARNSERRATAAAERTRTRRSSIQRSSSGCSGS